jgi:hypothetical protein
MKAEIAKSKEKVSKIRAEFTTIIISVLLPITIALIAVPSLLFTTIANE